MKYGRDRSRRIAESSSSSSEEDFKNDVDNNDSDRHSTTSSSKRDRHSTTPSPKRERIRKSRKRSSKEYRRGLGESSDDNLPAKFCRKNSDFTRRSHHVRSPKSSSDEDRKWIKKRYNANRRRSRSLDSHIRYDGQSKSSERHNLSKSKKRSRSRSRSPCSSEGIRNRSIKKEESDHEANAELLTDTMKKTAREDAIWAERRRERDRRCEWGVRSVWGRSPLMHEIHEIYEEYEKMEKEQQKEEEQFPKALNTESAESKISSKTKKEKKKKQKDKKAKRKREKKKKSSESEEEWVELTAEMREAEAAREKMEEAAMIGPAIPNHLQQKQAALIDTAKRVNYGKDMLRGEAAAMASYIAQGKRIPRRGEIGLSSAEILEFEKIGYVMSGTRHKSMEATRLRKENQVMTAEEKRLLSGFTHDERKKKEEIVLQQFKSFIESKKGKS